MALSTSPFRHGDRWNVEDLGGTATVGCLKILNTSDGKKLSISSEHKVHGIITIPTVVELKTSINTLEFPFPFPLFVQAR